MRSPTGQPRSTWQVRVQVGSVYKRLIVRGPREFRWQLLGGWRVTDPTPVSEVPLDYRYAFGGHYSLPDEDALTNFGSMKRGIEMTERDLPYPNKPVGVGGWLMFYIWVVCIILPFIFVVKILEFLREQDVVENADWFNYFLETVPYTSAFFVFCHLCMAVVLYASNKKITRYIVVLLIWLSGPLLNASLLAFCLAIMPPEAGEYFLAKRIPSSMFNLVWSVVWTLYFLRSKRVANTYCRDGKAIKNSAA